MERLGPGIYAYLRTLLRDDEADEAYADFSENLMRALPGFRWECSLRAWAHRIAFHSATRIWRRPGRRLEGPLPSSLSRLGPGDGPVEPVLSSRHAGLAQLRDLLPAEDRHLLTLRIDRELEWEEVVAVLAGDGADPAPDGAPSVEDRARDAAALRKRFERLVKRLREEARSHGLIE
ncbi:MAG TPA: sigma factor [Anaeromyxobacteraceae bacterium]|nr:sigma factor [Anaeromyxobacteraceae bacterium]